MGPARWERIKRNQIEKANWSEGFSVPVCVSIYFYPRRKLLNIAMFSFTLLSSLCKTSRIHLSTWFFPEFDVLCLQGRTNLAAVALEAEGEQNSSKAGYFVHPGAPEGCHLFLLLRILLAKLTAFFWPWLGHLDSGKSYFFLSLLDRKCILAPNTSVACVLIWRKLYFFFLRRGDKGKFWLELSVLKAERKQSLRHQQNFKHFSICKAAYGQKGKAASWPHWSWWGMCHWLPWDERSTWETQTSCSARHKYDYWLCVMCVAVAACRSSKQTGCPLSKGLWKPRSKRFSLPHRTWNQSLRLT